MRFALYVASFCAGSVLGRGVAAGERGFVFTGVALFLLVVVGLRQITKAEGR